tara:strand:- start:1490 stop:1987 length:498 start_codon:yes stop_codon:yes gene_type:complete
MKHFKDYTLSELKLIAKSFNKHIVIDFTKMKKTELVKVLEERLEHDEKGEIQLKKKLTATHTLPILKSEVLKYVENNPDSSVKLAISRLMKHYSKKYDSTKAEIKTGREVERIYTKHKGKKDVSLINEAVIDDIDEIIEDEKSKPKKEKMEKMEKRPVGRPKKVK